MILAGIDEAGYGPLLGPLVVSGVVFSVPDALAEANLWEVLAASICDKPARDDVRLPIADSKKLYNRKLGLTTLERTALVMLHVMGSKPRTLRALLSQLAPQVLDDLTEYPWYADYDARIPMSTTVADVTTRANAVRRDLKANGIKPLAVFSEPMPEGHFNRQLQQTRNKATVLMGLALRIIKNVVDGSEGRVQIHIDRHGGREYYLEKLMTSFEGARTRVLQETEERSVYEFTHRDRRIQIEFLVNGESHHLPIALASIYSKYLRELLMEALNGYFAQRIAGLLPTAGYFKDAKRFISQIEATVRAEKLDRALLVRNW